MRERIIVLFFFVPSLVFGAEDASLIRGFVTEKLRLRYEKAGLESSGIKKESVIVVPVSHVSSGLYHCAFSMPFKDAYFIVVKGKVVWLNEPDTGSGQTRFHFLPDQGAVVFSVIQGSSNEVTKFRVLRIPEDPEQKLGFSRWITPKDNPESLSWKFFDLNMRNETISFAHPLTKKIIQLGFSVM